MMTFLGYESIRYAIASFVILVGTGILIAAMAWAFTYTGELPKCAEDVVIVGHGEYSYGRWDYYSCGPALDDL